MLFRKKEEKPEVKEEPAEEKKEEKQESIQVSGNVTADITRIASEIDRLKASTEAFAEVRKMFMERFTRTSEQIGELRSMILERDKSIQEIELKAMKAADMVESVHPEKIMTEVQKQDAKLEALKANLEGNEAIMDRVLEELKDAKKKIEFFRGVDEIINLSEEVKKELIEIKKVESKVNIDADKVETIYSETRKKMKDLDEFSAQIQESKAQLDQNTKDIDFVRNKLGGLAEKDELDRLVSKVQRYIDALKELQKKSALTQDIDKIRTILESLK